MTGTDLAQVITAVGGILTIIIGGIGVKAARRDTNRAQEATTELERERLELEQRRHEDGVKDHLIEQLNVQLDRANARADREREFGEKHYARAEKCDQTNDRLRRDLHDLAMTVRDEALRSAAIDGVTAADLPVVEGP